MEGENKWGRGCDQLIPPRLLPLHISHLTRPSQTEIQLCCVILVVQALVFEAYDVGLEQVVVQAEVVAVWWSKMAQRLIY